MSARTDAEQAQEDTTDAEGTVLDDAEKSPDALDDGQEVPQEDTVPASATAEPSTVPIAAQTSNLAELSTQLREAAAEVAEIAAQAGRLGVTIDAAQRSATGTTPEALRSLVLQRAAAAADARDIVAAPPSPVLPKVTESPIVAAAKRAASAGVKAERQTHS